MLKWTFNSGIEKDLKTVSEMYYSIMKEHNLKWLGFRINGFNSVEVEIIKVSDVYEVRHINEDPYTPHYLSGDEYEKWKEDRNNRIKNGFIKNKNIDWELNEKPTQEFKDISLKLIDISSDKRNNEIYYISYRMKEKYISHRYFDEVGFKIYEEFDSY